ncbi:hypothetical protein M2271_006495 [Streptomyces sp. LBL]|uniref:hypothetical protein n=1 Tax=Streptomyces sp. LBL TaxID=2940562 RepID=UPI002476B30D|nr:hypothetical protein [Streptomyces sp. LBL]MDH6628662.1 hypothetical protein [Streptomyces sp. LBL]
MALIVEEIGLLAADKRRVEPTTIVRPPRFGTERRIGPGTPPRPTQPAPEPQAPRMTGHRQMLMAAMQTGMVRSG